MASFPVEVLLGIYLGLLVGIIPSLVSGVLAFGFRYVTGVTLPGFAVVVLAVALAGVNGGLLALADRTITQGPDAVRIVTAIIVVSMGSLYAHAKGDAIAAEVPRKLSMDRLRQRHLSREVVDFVGGRHQVTVRVVGEVADMEGYPPLSEELRGEIRGGEWTFPADLRVGELERRLEDRLRSEFDLGDVAASIDERGRATVSAAPPFSGLSRRVAEGRHAVSVDALLPTGLARGDEVTVITADAQVRGTVVSAKTGGAGSRDGRSGGADGAGTPESGAETPDAPAVEGTGRPPAAVRAPTTDGGEGRLTVAVHRTDAEPLLRADTAKVVVESRGSRREYELVSLLRRAGQRFRRVTVGEESALAGTPLAEAGLRERFGVAVFAAREADEWRLVPHDEEFLAAGSELYVVGDRRGLDAFVEAVA